LKFSCASSVAWDDTIANAVNDNVATALFVLEDYPSHLFLISLILIAGFFVTSSDSGSLVVDNLTSGKIDAPVGQRIFWAIAEGTVGSLFNRGVYRRFRQPQ
jgi:choline/glycine/proline betaine transport protein